jgi:hypothetical protein
MKKIHLFVLLLCGALAAQAQPSGAEKAIRTLMANQVTAWNEGRIADFMYGYWESDSLMYIGKNAIKYGYQGVLLNYQKNYADRASMGTLAFDLRHVKPLGRRHYFVVGKWQLTRPEKGDISGHFSLIFEKKGQNWVIIADHSS